jgi:glycerol uptake facilitator-like aquaporin
VLAQFVGGALGVLAVLALLGHAFADPPVSYVATVPGPPGAAAALAAEAAIAFGLMLVILLTTNTQHLMRPTGLRIGRVMAADVSSPARPISIVAGSSPATMASRSADTSPMSSARAMAHPPASKLG